MSAEQLCFFRFSRPLVDLLGKEFFQAVPAQPGVYVFVGERQRVLYVGQSKNLRVRLAYYKNAQPEREPRRIIRLVHQARRIELQLCATPEAALARELELIQQHQPRFNVRHALSRTYSFFGFRTVDGALCVRVALEEKALAAEVLVGAFKNRGLCRRALFAIARTAWSLDRAPETLFDFPIGLLDRPKINEISVPQELRDELRGLVEGQSADFLHRTESCRDRAPDPFVRNLFEADQLILTEFFQLAERMRTLREECGCAGLLPQIQVDRQQVRRSCATAEAR